jgi:hypothetical protein
METAVTILRELWRRRVGVALFAVVAIAVGALVAFKPSLPPESRKYEVGMANARVLVDTPASQAVEVAPKGSETLGARASLLANLMTDGELRDAIAKRAGLDPSELVAVGPTAADPDTATPTPRHSARANLLTTRVLITDAGEQLPIIDVDAQATDAQAAAKLANAAVAGLQEYMDSKASVDGVSDTRRLRVRPLGAAQARTVARGPSSLLALVATIFVFCALCAALLLADELARGWRAASDIEDALRDSDLDAWQLEREFYDREPERARSDDDAEVGARGA